MALTPALPSPRSPREALINDAIKQIAAAAGGGGLTPGSPVAVTDTGSPVLASAATSSQTGTHTFVPASDCFVRVVTTAKATNSSGAQGAYVWPLVGVTNVAAGISGGPAQAALTTDAQQVVASPLNNTTVTGSGVFYLQAGTYYRFDYGLRVGTGAGNVTFSSLATTYTPIYLGA